MERRDIVMPIPNPEQTPSPNATRIERLREEMEKQGVGAMLISHPTDIFYMSGFRGVEPQEREVFALVTPTHTHLIIRSLYVSAVQSQSPDFSPSGVMNFQHDALPTIVQLLQQDPSTEQSRAIGIQATNLTVAENEALLAAGMQTKDLPVAEFRTQKDETEIAAIAKACEASDSAFDAALSFIKRGTTETQLRNALEQHMKDQGYEKAFDTIVAFGPHAAFPHYSPDDTPLEENQFIVMDFGAKGRDGYNSDMTRTVFFGTPTEEQKRIYATVLKANRAATAFLQKTFVQDPHAVVTGKGVDRAARAVIEQAGFGEFFTHGLGHGIGLDVHEEPFLNTTSNDPIQKGCVFSNEPGIYIEGENGVRIEDLLVIRENGKVDVLAHSPKDLICIDPATGTQTIISEKELLSLP